MLVELDSLRDMAATYQTGVHQASQKEFNFIQQFSIAKARADRLKPRIREQSDELDMLALERDALLGRNETSENVAQLICTLVKEGRLSIKEIKTLKTDLDGFITVPEPAAPHASPMSLSSRNTMTSSNCPARIASARQGRFCPGCLQWPAFTPPIRSMPVSKPKNETFRKVNAIQIRGFPGGRFLGVNGSANPTLNSDVGLNRNEVDQGPLLLACGYRLVRAQNRSSTSVRQAFTGSPRCLRYSSCSASW